MAMAGQAGRIATFGETLKKTFPMASTFTRELGAVTFGAVIFAVPLFGTLAASTVGKVAPPSVEREIFTLAALIGALLVLATFHVTVWVVPGRHSTPAAG